MQRRKTLAGILAALMAFVCISTSARAAELSTYDNPGWITPKFQPTFSDTSKAPRRLRSDGDALPASYGFSLDEDGTLAVAGQTPVRDQGSNGVCWAFATIAAMEANALRTNNDENPDYSETHLVYSTSQYGASKSDISNREQGYDTTPTEGGNLYYAASYLMRGTSLGGTLAEETDPFFFTDVKMPYREIETTKTLGERKYATVQNIPIIQGEKTAVYSADNDTSVREMMEIKKAVMTYGAVSTSIYWASFPRYYSSSTGAYYVDEMQPANHAVAIVGWDDSFPAERFNSTPPGNGAWLIKNSWGTGGTTGYKGTGYYWVSYYDGRIGEWTYAIDGVEAYDPYTVIHEYDFRIDDDTLDIGSYTVVFPRKTDAERVKALRIGVNSPVEFDVRICADYQPEAGPEDNTFVFIQHISLERPGFYTVPLEQPELITGECFSICVDMCSADNKIYTYSAAARPQIQSEDETYDAAFIKKSKDKSWNTISAEGGYYPIPCIKAVCEDLSENNCIRITGTEPCDEGLAVTVDTDMAKPVLFAAAAYQNGQMVTKALLVTKTLRTESEIIILPISQKEGLSYSVFVLDPATLAPLTDKATWTPE